VAVRAEGAKAVFEVLDTNAAGTVEGGEASAALELRCAQLGVELQLLAGTCRLTFPLA
jgi:hypothetical protein